MAARRILTALGVLVFSTRLAALRLCETQRHAFGPWLPCEKLCAVGLGCPIKWRCCSGGKGDNDHEGDGDEEDDGYLCVHYAD